MDIEQLYWQFDAAHRGIGEYAGMARSERDAFKLVVGHALAEKDREIAELKEWKSIVMGTGTDQEAVIRMAAAEYTRVAVAAWKEAYHALMERAMLFAAATISDTVSVGTVKQAQQFLDSPEVQAWREQEDQP